MNFVTIRAGPFGGLPFLVGRPHMRGWDQLLDGYMAEYGARGLSEEIVRDLGAGPASVECARG